MTERIKKFIVGDEEHRLRIDRFLFKACPEIGRREVERLVRLGYVRVSGKARGGGYFLKRGDEVELLEPSERETDSPLLIHQTRHLLVVGKPPGMPTNPVGQRNDSLLDWLWGVNQSTPFAGEPGIIHRIDRDTSGLILFSLSPDAHRLLVDAFRRGEIRKVYLALVVGQIAPKRGTIRQPLSRSTSGRTYQDRIGKPARTDYKTVRSNRELSLLEVRPRTGRTHQIRVHLAGFGHPILGDPLYGQPHSVPRSPRLWLHAASCELPESLAASLSLPTRIECPLWRDLAEYLDQVGFGDYERNR